MEMGKLFGTDGVRGIANVELTAELAYKLGRAGAYVLTREKSHRPKILVGMDTRISGHMLKSAIVSGVCSMGAQAIVLGIIPTPAIAYLVRHYGADAGIVISASHNPFEFNGIKFFDSNGYKLPDHLENEIEEIVLNNCNNEDLLRVKGEDIGIEKIEENAVEDYISYVKNTIDTDLSGLKIAVDCANGASYRVAPEVLERLGAQVIVCENKPNGVNINDKCGSTYISRISKFTIDTGADVGLAFDGDADRVLACDENGDLVDGDKILAITGLQLKKEGKLKKNTIVVTVMTNVGFEMMAAKEGINVVRTKVGDRYVLEEMIKNGYVLGGEQSGHIIFLDYGTTGDGIVTALQLLRIMKITGKKLSELASVMEALPQVLVNAKVRNEKKQAYLEDKIIADMCRKLEDEFKGEGRVLIRPSGTEPIIRVMIEGKELDIITEKAKKLASIIEERLG